MKNERVHVVLLLREFVFKIFSAKQQGGKENFMLDKKPVLSDSSLPPYVLGMKVSYKVLIHATCQR